MVLVLYPLKVDTPIKKWGGKRGTVRTSDLSSVKMIFTLLAKMVTVYMGFFKIHVRKPSLERLFSGLSINWTRVLNRLHESLHKLFVQFFSGERNGDKSYRCRSIRERCRTKESFTIRGKSSSRWTKYIYKKFSDRLNGKKVLARVATSTKIGHLD